MEQETFRIKRQKEKTGIFDCKGKELLLGSRVETETGEKGTVVFYECNYMIQIDTKIVRINRLCEVIK